MASRNGMGINTQVTKRVTSLLIPGKTLHKVFNQFLRINMNFSYIEVTMVKYFLYVLNEQNTRDGL